MALGVNLVITVPLAGILNIWQDEAYTLETTSRGFGYAFTQAIGFEQNAPLYFVVMSVWRHAGDGIFFLRLFSVLCIAGTVLLLPGLARRYVPHVDGVLVAAVVACSPFVVWAAVELRVYALIVLMSALLLRTFFDAFMEENPGKGAAIAYAVCVAVALYTQYYLAFLVAAQGATLLFYNRRAILRYALAGRRPRSRSCRCSRSCRVRCRILKVSSRRRRSFRRVSTSRASGCGTCCRCRFRIPRMLTWCW